MVREEEKKEAGNLKETVVKPGTADSKAVAGADKEPSTGHEKHAGGGAL